MPALVAGIHVLNFAQSGLRSLGAPHRSGANKFHVGGAKCRYASLYIISKTSTNGLRCSRPIRRRRSAVNRVHVVGEASAAEVKDVKDFLNSPRMQDVFRRVNAISTVPLEFVWLDEVKP